MAERKTIRLYHTGFDEIREPDLLRGRKNADLGQGFYLSPDREFSEKWAFEKKDAHTYINAYELKLDGLRICRLKRDMRWYEFIFANRAGRGIGPADEAAAGAAEGAAQAGADGAAQAQASGAGTGAGNAAAQGASTYLLVDDPVDADLIIGPIANDTIYDVLGITTSGFLTKEEALTLLQIGPEYFQAVIRTPAALAALTWTGARMLSSEEIRASQAIVRAEAEEYQIAFAQMLEKLTDGK